MPQERASDAGGAPISGRRRGTAQKAMMTALALGLTGVIGGVGTWSAFSATTSNDANQFKSGTVTITDEDAGAKMFNVTAMKPGETTSACLRVRYTGTLASNVALYGATTESNTDGTNSMLPSLNVKITRGVDTAPTNLSCAEFSTSEPDYAGGPAGAGVIYDGLLGSYPKVGDTHLADPRSPWNTNDVMDYGIDVTLASSVPNAAQSDTVNQDFVWKSTNQ